MSVPDKVLDAIDHLEPLPLTVQKLMELVRDQNTDIRDIVRILELDGAVAANVLRAANSARFGSRFEIVRVRDAAVRMGTVTLLEIALGRHLRAIWTAAPMYDLSEEELWLHGAAASQAVQAISEQARGSIPPVSGLAALVHDIGKLIMVRYVDARVSAILTLCEARGLSFVEAEKELFGFDHAEVGAAMARRWLFPDSIQCAIERHHQFPFRETNPVLDAVALANLSAKSAGIGLGAEGLNMRIDYSGCRERIGLTMEGFERACAQTAVWINDLKKGNGVHA
jgi:putative nucleotidyltransferase with HDIG domain